MGPLYASPAGARSFDELARTDRWVHLTGNWLPRGIKGLNYAHPVSLPVSSRVSYCFVPGKNEKAKIDPE